MSNVLNALESVTEKILVTDAAVNSNIIGGNVIKILSDGTDPEYPESGDMLPGGLYIRLHTANNQRIYISAYEIDKAFDIIAGMNMDKADKGDVEALEVEINNKVSNTEFELLQSDLNLKTDKKDFDELSNTVELKADKDTVDELSNTVELKADKDTIDSIKNDIISLQNVLGSLNDTDVITAIQDQIDLLNSELQKKISLDNLNIIDNEINDLSNAISDNYAEIELLKTDISKKASTIYVQGQVKELNTAITGISSKLTSKADKKDIAAKASQSDLDTVVKKLNTLNISTAEGFAEFEECCNLIKAELNNKVSLSEFNTFKTTAETAIADKASLTYVNKHIQKVDNKLENIESELDTKLQQASDNLYEFECEVNNELSGINSALNNQSKQILNNISQITQLKQNDVKINNTLKHQWVQVLTPEEYNSLAPVGNPSINAKQPNIVYMLVRYNKPVAVYIGEVLIAKAEEKTSTGFVYNFPIIF
jgi:predicted  nucleic acid-binding Zn-ribbon protein